jgi:pyridinium-3,5-bisthiocarboxylic acid mononucleotide nickel chelatase
MNNLYCDCFSGISGDMFLAALLDAGLPMNLLNSHFERLPIDEKIRLSSRRVRKGALDANQLVIEGFAQTVAHVHSDDHPHTHEHVHDHEHEHHGHTHEHDHAEVHSHEAAHAHRNLNDILTLIENTHLPVNAAQFATRIFSRLAIAEAKVHGEPVEKVYFHEVGALDSIVDILGVSIGLDYFNVQQVYSSALPFSSGMVNTQHGSMPVPVPATLALIESAHIPLRPAPDAGELNTPTGVAILAELAVFQRPAMRVTSVGVGAGNKDFPWPNIFRIMIGESDSQPTQPMIQISCNIDDMNPELYGLVMDHLFTAGAVDVFLTPIQMKKNRPGTMIGVIAPQWLEKQLAELLLHETSSFGVRVESIYRYEAQREVKTIETGFGPIKVKEKWVNGVLTGTYPEFEDCKAVAEKHHLPLEKIYRQVLALLENKPDQA